MIILKVIFWLIILAIAHSWTEIQIEGSKGGWAKNLPTFRINNWITKILIGKEITGYHICMITMFSVIFHGFFLFHSWSLKKECLVLGVLCLYFILEDFLWFVFNKHYGLENFRVGKIHWHKRWIWNIPVSYLLFGILGLELIIYGLF